MTHYMRRIFGRATALWLAAALLAGCVATTAVPLSRDVWRLQVRVDDARSPGTIEERVLRYAADLAFRNGATHFLIEDAPREPVADETARAVLYGDTQLFIVAPGAPDGRGDTVTALVTLLERDDPRVGRAYSTLDVISG